MPILDRQQYAQYLAQPLEQAQALPFGAYTDSALLGEEIATLFHGDWVFACAQSQLSQPGDYFAFILAGEPVVIIHGRDGQLRALSNSCRHRGTPLLDDGYGQLKGNIVCPYHAWSYSDGGEFKGAPMTGAIKLDKPSHCLPRYALESWQGLVFVNLNGQARSLSQRLAGVAEYLKAYPLAQFTQAYSSAPETWQCNWKLAVENGIESYHLFQVHRDTLETVTPTRDAFYLAGGSEWTLTAGRIKEQRSGVSRWLLGETPPAMQHYVLIFVPPSFIGVLTYESFDWISVLPLGVDSCQIRSGGISTDTPSDDAPEQQFSQAFLAEDKALCERVQQGMSARFGRGGKLVELERILVDFRQYLLSRQFKQRPVPLFQALGPAQFLSED
ncbi:aromatic ring-hydroxylating oxygenase subunit alpha [Ferrimonas marina]|uniref:Phenylpropionate dioxygenase, large terminal subunit n=1 Tax=Ferrimonas marina TaxID=299255 RepID=A0A1M5Z659_9GAMM|nr:aromatic ring-hydroxylating dioxygenase subunit alpha [Ferrimonas marina]SHI19373.1 Phenylpropionate dioxygenase, large terminal subunit [Ferrimonas marina]